MNILLTGGAGFIGSHVAELLQADHDLVIVDDINDYYEPSYKRANLALLSPKTFYEIDITDKAALSEVFNTHHFDTVIHLAARAGVRPSIANPQLYASVNTLGTQNLLELSVQHEVQKFVFGSSSSVYGNSAQIPFVETDLCLEPISPYAASKRAAELLVEAYYRKHGLRSVNLRFFTVYGERGRPDMAPYLFTHAILTGQAIKKFGDGSTSRDYTYVKDIASGIVAAAMADVDFETINLGHHSPITLNEFIGTIEQITGQTALIEQLPMQPGDVERTYADISKAREILNWEPHTSFADGMTQFIEWLKTNRL